MLCMCLLFAQHSSWLQVRGCTLAVMVPVACLMFFLTHVVLYFVVRREQGILTILSLCQRAVTTPCAAWPCTITVLCAVVWVFVQLGGLCSWGVCCCPPAHVPCKFG